MQRKHTPPCCWFNCLSCRNVWYVLDKSFFNSSEYDFRKNFWKGLGSPYKHSQTTQMPDIGKKCPKCQCNNVKEINIKEALCSWIDDETSFQVVFGHNGYYREGVPVGNHWDIAWDMIFEEELINLDATFKKIVSELQLATRNGKGEFRLIPEIYEAETGFKIYYPFLQEASCMHASGKEIPRSRTLELVSFLKTGGALDEDGIAFSYCLKCGSKNKMDSNFGRACEVCSEDDLFCDGCGEYDEEEECRLGHSKGHESTCCRYDQISEDCDMDQWRLLEASCNACGYEYDDVIVELKLPGERVTDGILNPEECDCFGLHFKPVLKVLNGLDKGFAFQEIVKNHIKSQGWKTSESRRGKSGVVHDTDTLCGKDGRFVLVESKRKKSTNSIVLADVFNIFARMIDLKVDRGIIIATTQNVTRKAEQFSQFYGIKIVTASEFFGAKLESIMCSCMQNRGRVTFAGLP